MENIKHFIKPDQANVIPPLNKKKQIYTEEKDIANILSTFFAKQTLLDESQATLPQTVKIPHTNLILSLRGKRHIEITSFWQKWWA